MSELPLPRPSVARDSLIRAFNKLPKPCGPGLGPMTFVVSRENRLLLWEAIHRARERAGIEEKGFTSQQVGELLTKICLDWMGRAGDVG